MSQSNRTSDFDSCEKLISLKNSRTAFVGHVTKYINKINDGILASEKFENIICLNERLTVSLEKLKGVIDEFINLAECPEEIEKSNDIYLEQNSRVLKIQDIIQNYLSTCRKSEALSSKISLKSKSSSSSSKSKSKVPSSSSSASRKKAQAELLLRQSYERFHRKSKLLEKKKSLELELERENVTEAENKVKLLQLQERYNIENESLCDTHIKLDPLLNHSQTANEKVEIYLSSLEKESHFAEVYLSQPPQRESQNLPSNNSVPKFSISQLDQPRQIIPEQ